MTRTILVPVAFCTLVMTGCYSSSDTITGRDTTVTPDAPPDTTPPDATPDTTPPDVVPDAIPPDVSPDSPPDIHPDPPPEVVDADVVDAPPAGIVGDACSSRRDCSGMPTSSADCWHDIMGFLSFPGGYCSADCYADWECGPEGECVDLSFISLCLRTCEYVEDCRESDGYDCYDMPWVGGGPYCLPTG